MAMFFSLSSFVELLVRSAYRQFVVVPKIWLRCTTLTHLYRINAQPLIHIVHADGIINEQQRI